MLGVIVAVALVVIATSLLTRVRSLGGTASVHRTFWCPIPGAVVRACFQEEQVGEPIDVVSCSAFHPPTGMTCSRRCLGRERFETLSGLALRER
jgi:hypothetical protein